MTGRPSAIRLVDAPIVGPDSHPGIGTNIQGPSVLRVPGWVEEPLGRLYLHFADHKGTHLRLAFADEANTPIAPVNTPKTAPDDPQFAHRLPFYGIEDVGAEQLPLPVYMEGDLPPTPSMAPTVGEQTDEVLADLGLSAERIAELRAAGVVGPR